MSKAQIFVLPLNDLGSGAVNTTPLVAAGSATATFTRATVAWTKLSTGLWTQVATGTARSCYLGATTAVGAYGGYFSEDVGTQLVTPTASIRDMTDASWVNGGTMTVAKTGTGIDGVTNSCSRLTGGAVSATNTLFQTLTAAASSRTYSCWIKRVTGTGTINISQNGGSTYTDVTSQINSSTFTRVSLTASVLNASFGIQVVTDTDVILVDFNQFEAGAFATSPMASAGAARQIDALSYASTGNFSNTAGTAYADITLNASASSNCRFIADSSTTAGPLINGGTTSNLKAEIFDGTTQVIASTLVALGTTGKCASSWSGTAMSVVLNGGTVASGTYDGGMITNNIVIMGPSGVQPYGMAKNILIYNTAVSSAQLQAMTV